MKLELIALDKNWAREIAADGGASLQASFSNYCTVAPYLEDAVDALIAIFDRTGGAASWTAYLARLPSEREVVGMCSLTDNGCGRVSIGFHTFPPYQGKGFARAMVAELVALAFARTETTEVLSHTPPQEGPAVAILRLHGFRCTGTANDTDHGRRWLWSLNRSEHANLHAKPLFIPMVRPGVLSSLLARQYGR